MSLVSVITPASRGLREISQLVRDFRNQTFQNFEHIIVYDGKVPVGVQVFMDEHLKDYNIKFIPIDKDMGNMSISPGTRPRNHGLSIARGTYVVFCDDDDRYKDTYLETLVDGIQENIITVTQMSCQASRMYRNGDPKQIVLVPEVGLVTFPQVCHVGTPCFMVPRVWALEDPWQHEPEHDFRFIYRIVTKHKPNIYMKYGMQVDVDGLVIGQMQDWVSKPPFFRGII